ncbi:MAG: LuxR C-terminal-related transcriptional regulator [Mycobacteriales bacterium]
MTHASIGVAPAAETVYRVLLRRPRWRDSQLAAELAWPVDEVSAAVDRLRAEDLLARSADDVLAVRAVEPRLALRAMTARRLDGHGGGPLPSAIAVERFIALHEATGERFRAEPGGSLDKLSALAERLAAGVEEELVLLVPGHAPGSYEFTGQVAGDVLRRGSSVRAVWGAHFLADPAVVTHARWLGARWAVPRAVARVPVRAMIMDREAAVLVDQAGGVRWLLTGAALTAVLDLADRLWEHGAEVRAGAAVLPEPSPLPRNALVLRLLADGLTDDAVARRIGVSVRTVRNDVASVMVSLGARSRFQAGVRAARLGLP